MKNVNKNASSKAKIKNTIALKRSIYAVVLSVVFVVGAVLMTVLSTVLARRFPINLDLTVDKVHTMTEENVDFIKGVEREVNIYVCLTKDEYDCTTTDSNNIAYYAAVNKFVDYNSDNAAYFAQTVELLERYSQYNKNIHVTYLDVSQPSAKEHTVHFDNYGWEKGDILVESIFTLNGERITRRTTVPFDETYTLEPGASETQSMAEYYFNGYDACYALYGFGYGYLITENKIEQALSAAIYKVTSDSTPSFLVPKSYCNWELINEVLDGTLTVNNYTLSYVDGLLSSILTEENMKNYTGIVMADCNTDISESDRALLEKFLDNDGKKGKSFVFFAGTQTYKYTNLCQFLGEWGIGFQSGILYETSTEHHMASDPTTIYQTSLRTDYTSNVDSRFDLYIASNSVPMKQLYNTHTTPSHARTATVLMSTASNATTTIMPIDQKASEWKPTNDMEHDAFPTAIITEDAVSIDGQFALSHVVAFAASDFIAHDWSLYRNIGNLNYTLDVFNASVGLSDTPFSFVSKSITVERYDSSAVAVNIIRCVFVAAVPLALVAVGVTVWIRRRRR